MYEKARDTAMGAAGQVQQGAQNVKDRVMGTGTGTGTGTGYGTGSGTSTGTGYGTGSGTGYGTGTGTGTGYGTGTGTGTGTGYSTTGHSVRLDRSIPQYYHAKQPRPEMLYRKGLRTNCCAHT